MKTKGLIVLIVFNGILYTNKAFTQIFVNTNATGNNNGTSWYNAYTKLQDALYDSILSQIKEIWVAKGTHYPDEGIGSINDDKTSTFNIPDSVKVYGGFSGTETNLTQRNFFVNETILSGDIDGVPDSSNNAYNVVTFINVSNQTLLDGFTITGGNAHEYTINNFQGGGIYNFAYNGNSSPNIKNCKIIYNSAENGGGICNYGNTNPTVSNCIISGNISFYGGGISNISEQVANQPIFINCLISGNKSFFSGGGVHNYNSNSNFINCTLSGNYGGGGGGGMVNYYNSHPVFVNSIIWGNTKFNSQIKNDTNSLPSYRYCDIEQSGGSSSWNLLIGFDGGHNMDTNPQFINISDTSAAPIFNGDFHVNNSSVVIDSGTPDTTGLNLPVSDLDGNPRITNNIIDIGPYEYNFNNVPSYWSSENVPFYPNPTKRFININFEQTNEGTYKIVNTEGQIIQEGQIDISKCTIDLIKCSTGIYILQIEINSIINSYKLIIRK